MKFKGVIFDFNGTLLWDTPLHNEAWDIFLQKHSLVLTDTEKREKIHGKGNIDIFNTLFRNQLSTAEIEIYTNEKEAIYRELCHNHKLKLAIGSIELFELLMQKQIRYCIATSSGIENIGFFKNEYQLNKWFPEENIIYHKKGMMGKPNPEIFIRAMKTLNILPHETIIFEDSIWGIKAAENAKAGKIIIVNSNNEDYSEWNHDVINNFNMVDKQLFL